MKSSPQGSRHSGEQNANQGDRANIPAQMQTEAEPVTQPPEGGLSGEVDLPLRVQIPGYEVLELLGKGGMGVVYKARQAALGRIVALKMILHAEHAGPTERQRFQTEAEAAARLQHPNIVQVFEVGTHEGLPYLALEYCPGGSLAQRIKDNPLSIREAVQLVETLAVAVHVAHAANVVHRDLNPANVLLTASGQPKITDFGLAKKLGEPSRTQSGVVVGTPSYMSPEQAGGKAKEVGPATDIYALGAILYELLTGRPPFKAATQLDTILQVVADAPTPVRRLRPEVPRDLETICHKCLEKEPTARYGGAESLAEDLRHFLAGEPIRVRRVSSWERAVKWAKRRPAVVIAAAASLAAFVLLFALLIVLVYWVPFMGPRSGIDIAPPTEKGDDTEAANGRLSKAASERIKRATVFLRVRTSDGKNIQGTGFFTSIRSKSVILTNAHVVGMSDPKSQPPSKIEVIINSGQLDESKTTAHVLHVDRQSNLAVLEIDKPQKELPKPLVVSSAAKLRELDHVYVFSFPFAERLGEEIIIHEASVSSIRRKNGQIERIQFFGSLAPGGSGGPLVDSSGEVVGVAESRIPGEQINFAIAGDRVIEFMAGVPEKKEEKKAANGGLNAAARDRVKRATVLVRVTLPDGTKASGSGFFGCKEARNIVLTNAYVVGMLAPESQRPHSVEVVVNSGEADEWKTSARVLGVDRFSDLAVLDIGIPSQPLPEPLTVKSAAELHELDDVYIFGFPYGELLGKEITIWFSSVSALRRKNGQLNRIQLNGGMDPGNSGGPIVDASGEVVGVTLSGILGRQINFAIPGDRVQAVLDGDISELTLQQPYLTHDNKVAVPAVVEIIDPRNLIKQVGLEVWAGDKPTDIQSRFRPPTTTQPPAKAGDSPRIYVNLKYKDREGKGEIILPDLPPGKVYWQQPRWIDGKVETHWAAATPMQLPSPPVYRKTANLSLRYTQGFRHTLDLNIENIFKISSNVDDPDAIRIRTTAAFTETVASTGQKGTVLTLRYRQPPHRQLILPDGQTRPNTKDEQFINELPRLLTTSVQLDRLGNILRQTVDQQSLAQINPQQVQSIKSFHERIQQALESLSVSLPPRGTADPLDSWNAERALPIDTPGKTESGKLDVTFIYLGSRKRDGRDEAVIDMDGIVRGKSEGFSGKATGQLLVDLANGQTILAELTVKLPLKALLSESGQAPRPVRVLGTMKFRMQRKE